MRLSVRLSVRTHHSFCEKRVICARSFLTDLGLLTISLRINQINRFVFLLDLQGAEKYENGKWSSIKNLPNSIKQGCAFFHSSNDDIIYISGKDISLFFKFPAKDHLKA